MSGLVIKRPVIVKVRVTDKFKIETITQIKKALKKVELEIEQIEFETKKLTLNVDKQSLQQLTYLRKQLEAEKKKHLELKTRLVDKIKEVEQWVLGIEVVEGTVDSYIELNIGDDWEKLMGTEIIIEDGKVIELRN